MDSLVVTTAVVTKIRTCPEPDPARPAGPNQRRFGVVLVYDRVGCETRRSNDVDDDTFRFWSPRGVVTKSVFGRSELSEV